MPAASCLQNGAKVCTLASLTFRSCSFDRMGQELCVENVLVAFAEPEHFELGHDSFIMQVHFVFGNS
jgi:hypothetical protein